jgi:hypothetical protein
MSAKLSAEVKFITNQQFTLERILPRYAVVENSRKYCPHCGNRDFRPSQSTAATDLLAKLFRFNPFRCRACGKRFYARLPSVAFDGRPAASRE